MAIIYPCTREQYDALPGLNQSSLKEFAANTPAKYQWKKSQPRKYPTKEMIVGSLTDSLTFNIPFEYRMKAYDDYKTLESRKWRDALIEKFVPIVDDNMTLDARLMAKSALSNEWFRSLGKGRSNICLTGIHEPTGIETKGLLDFAPDDPLVIADLKSTDDASVTGFGKSIASFGYDVQDIWYTDLWYQNYTEVRRFMFLCVESEAPYQTAVHEIRSENREKARAAVDRWMAAYKQCLETKTWPGYPTTPQYAEVPRWRFFDQ